MYDFMNTPRVLFSSSFRTSGLISAVMFLICFVTAHSASAATYTVTTTADSGAGSLRSAIASANAPSSGPDTITFAIPTSAAGCTAGICTITLTSGELTITSAATAGALTITNSTGVGNLLISGNNTSRVFYLNSGADLTINSVTITKGNGSGTFSGSGGGILNSGTLALSDSIVSGNTASFGGGGIAVSFGVLTLTNSTVSNNTSGNGGGAGISISTGSSVTLTNSAVSRNMTSSGSGGGILNGGTATLTNSEVSGNTASIVGGGIHNNQGKLILMNSTVNSNTASSAGGGISNDNQSTSTLTNSTVSGNTSSNSAGGGIYTNGTTNLTSVTITQNSSGGTTCAVCAGGIYNGGTANLNNTIIAGNTAANASASPDFGGAVAAGSAYNLIGNGQGMTGITNGDANQNQVGVDPKLDPTLQLNGGSTPNHALLAGSPAIDRGNSFGLTTDQRGFARPVDLPDAPYPNATGGDGSDIGAFEAQTAPLGPTAANSTFRGRALTPDGRGLANAAVILTGSDGTNRYTRTSSFGYFRFADIAAGSTIIISISSKQFIFEPIVINITEDLYDLSFIGQTRRSSIVLKKGK